MKRLRFRIDETIRKHARQHFCEIHIKPAGNRVVGQGKIDLNQLAVALNDAGYDKWLVYEASRDGSEPVASRQAIEKLVKIRKSSRARSRLTKPEEGSEN